MKAFRRSIKKYIRNLLNEDHAVPSADTIPGKSSKLNHSFDGWTIRLHRAHTGHIIEAWRNDSSSTSVGYANKSNYNDENELFIISDSEDMAKVLPDIFTQLMLKS